ncbi:MAG: hypothetical protein KatS3mg124_1334 [Porticoccaceae bacterium]|nr:MAG: hypothetical protein KatS3mg124_1334 [Porticoccaceae bacterium]
MDLSRLDPDLLHLRLATDFAERGYDLLDDQAIARLKAASAERGVLSLYLDTTPEALANNPLALFKNAVHEIAAQRAEEWDHEQRTTFDLLVKDVTAQLQAELERPRGRGLALFAAPGRALPKKGHVDYAFSHRFHLPYPVGNRVAFGERPLLTPLLVLRDESPRTGVILFDRQELRCFFALLGEVAPLDLVVANPDPVPMTKAHTWQGYGEHNHHQWQETHYRRYLAQAAVAVQKLAAAGRWKWLVLASPDRQEAEHLQKVLDPRVAQRVIGALSLPMSADATAVREAIRPILAEAEAAEERAALDQWEEALGRGKGVAGLADTLRAGEEYRLATLVVDEGFSARGWQCARCEALQTHSDGGAPAACEWCGHETLTELTDAVAELALRVLHAGGAVEIVHAPDQRERLRARASIGGVLRY